VYRDDTLAPTKLLVLFDEGIEVLHLPELTGISTKPCHLKLVEGFWIRSVCVHVDDPRPCPMRGGEGFSKEVLGSFSVSGRAEEKFQRVAM
jgi:hypothetical protein